MYSPQHSQPADSISTAAGGTISMATSNADLNWIANYIWGIADDVLRDLYVRGKYRDVILPMTVLRRLDAMLEDSKQNVLDMKAVLDEHGVVEQDSALRQAAGQAFYNTSKFTLRDLRARASRQQRTADSQAYLDGFSPNVQDILENFEFRNQIPRLSKADALGTLIEKLTSPDVNLSPAPVKNTDGTVRHPGLDNHGMGSIFEELVRRFNEENNEEAGEHWTPRDAVRLVAELVFLPVAEEIKSGTYLLYDGADPNRVYKAAEIKELKETGTRSEDAPPMIRRIHKRGKQADPLRGLFAATVDDRSAVVEYEPDSNLRDTEQIPLQEEGGIEAFLRSEVLPYAADAWYLADSVKVGYEISFTRYFYQPKPMRTLAKIRADIVAMETETETEGLLAEILDDGEPASTP